MPTPRALNTRHGLRTGTKSVVDGSGTVVDVGTLASLTTTSKSTIVAAVNEVKGNFVNITTSDVPEPAVSPTRLYFTDSRARTSISVTDSGGDGSLGYDNLTGVLTYTGPSAAEVRAHFSGGTGVTITDGVVAIGQPVSTSSNVTFANTTLTGVLYGPAQFVIDPAAFGDATGEVIILGNLTVQGTTTTINSTTLVVEDKNILLAKSAINSLQADGSGISVAGAEASILYTALTDSWDLNRTVKGVDGTVSSPTYSFATDPGLGLYRSADNQLSLATNGLERLRVGDTATTLVGSLNLIFDRGTYFGTVTTTTLTANRTYTLPNVTGTLVTSGDTGTITSAMIADGTIADIDINASAAIAFSKLASLTSANILVGSSGNVATSVSVTGDVTIGNTGVTAITAGVIVDGDISPTAEISVSKLADGAPRQLLETAADGVTVQWADNIDVPGTLDVTGVSTFDTKIRIGAAETANEREVAWNTDEGTLDVQLLNGVITRLGQDMITLCRNNTLSSIPKGTAVMFNGTVGNSGRIAVAPMVANGTVPGYVFFGVTGQAIAAGADGYVKSYGEVKGIDTNAFEENDILWCNPAVPGGFTRTEPAAPNLKLPVAAVISKANNGILMIRWATGSRLRDLHDVESNGSTANGDILVYNSTTSRWENGSTLPSLTVTSSLVVNGINITESARDVEESRLIRRNGTVSIGTPGTVPFGVGPIIPPGMSLVGIGPDAYNVIDVYSGSVC